MTQGAIQGEFSSNTETSKRALRGVDINGNTTLKLTSILLSGKNYSTWKNAAMKTLSARRALGYINGKKDAPIDISSEEYEDWTYNDNLVFSWILNSLSEEIVDAFCNAENSKILWDSIALQYGSESNVIRIYELKHFINHSTLGIDDLMTHNTKRKGVFDELRSLRLYTSDPLELQ